jgi:hypothetical protein
MNELYEKMHIYVNYRNVSAITVTMFVKIIEERLEFSPGTIHIETEDRHSFRPNCCA